MKPHRVVRRRKITEQRLALCWALSVTFLTEVSEEPDTSDYYAHFADGKTEAQRGMVASMSSPMTAVRSRSEGGVSELGRACTRAQYQDSPSEWAQTQQRQPAH